MTKQPFQNQDFEQVIGRACPLFDRLSDYFSPAAASDEDEIVHARLERWAKVVADGDEKLLAKRFEWEQLSKQDVRRCLSSVTLKDGKRLPPWAVKIKEWFYADPEAPPISLHDTRRRFAHLLNPKSVLPFEEAYLPFVGEAFGKLSDRAPHLEQTLTEGAKADLQRSLLAHLSNVASQALAIEFSTFRQFRGGSALNLIKRSAPETPSKNLYEAFVQELIDSRFRKVFRRYPVLAKLCVHIIEFWIEAGAEFLERFNADREYLAIEYNASIPLERIASLRLGVSDRHKRGRSVVELRFDSKLRLIYKPRDMRLERQFYECINWLNQRDDTLNLKTLKVLTRADYGWEEYAEYQPCGSQAELKKFYMRAGAILAVLHVLGERDCHHENLIVCGESPLVIDAECMLSAKRLTDREVRPGQGAYYQASDALEESVLSTLFLPGFTINREGGAAYDVSALGGLGRQETGRKGIGWKHLNTDLMEMVSAPVVVEQRGNVPHSSDEEASLRLFVGDIIGGFEKVYTLFFNNKGILLDAGGPLAHFGELDLRFLHRPTMSYAVTLFRASDPRYLRDGADRSIELEALCRSYISQERRPKLWSLLKAEREELEQLDIPRFNASADSVTLQLGLGQKAIRFAEISGFSALKARVDSLDSANLHTQTTLIKAALGSLIPAQGASCSNARSVPCERWLDYALEIGDKLEVLAVSHGEGSIAFPSFAFFPACQSYCADVLREGLYDGNCGVAVFFAALAKISGKFKYAELSRRALRVVDWLDDAEPDFVEQSISRRLGLGIGSGLGALIFGLTLCGRLLDDLEVIEKARRLSRYAHAVRIAGDSNFDIIAGSAGLLVSLLSLNKHSPSPTLLKQACACGDHLLAGRTATSSGARAWVTVGDKPLASFAHGASGIAFALVSLYRASDDPRYLEAAKEAFDYERSLFSPDNDGWPDLRPLYAAGVNPAYLQSWCNGSAGIGLARLACLPEIDDGGVRRDIEAAIRALSVTNEGEVDHPCCGTLGHAEFLDMVGRILDREELRGAALNKVSAVLARYDETQQFHLAHRSISNQFSPSLFQGLAGVGYMLLKLGTSVRLPSILVFD